MEYYDHSALEQMTGQIREHIRSGLLNLRAGPGGEFSGLTGPTKKARDFEYYYRVWADSKNLPGRADSASKFLRAGPEISNTVTDSGWLKISM